MVRRDGKKRGSPHDRLGGKKEGRRVYTGEGKMRGSEVSKHL